MPWWKDNVKMALREIRLRMSDMDSVESGWNSNVCFYERGNEISGSIKSGLFVHCLKWRASLKALRPYINNIIAV